MCACQKAFCNRDRTICFSTVHRSRLVALCKAEGRSQDYVASDRRICRETQDETESTRHSQEGDIVTQHMHADGFLSQRRTGAGGYLNVFGEPMFDGVT